MYRTAHEWFDVVVRQLHGTCQKAAPGESNGGFRCNAIEEWVCCGKRRSHPSGIKHPGVFQRETNKLATRHLTPMRAAEGSLRG